MIMRMDIKAVKIFLGVFLSLHLFYSPFLPSLFYFTPLFSPQSAPLPEIELGGLNSTVSSPPAYVAANSYIPGRSLAFKIRQNAFPLPIFHAIGAFLRLDSRYRAFGARHSAPLAHRFRMGALPPNIFLQTRPCASRV